MKTEFLFDKVVFSCGEEGTWLKIKLDPKNIDVVRGFVDSRNRKGTYIANFEEYQEENK